MTVDDDPTKNAILKYPEGYGSLVLSMTQQQVHLETTLYDILSFEFGLDDVEASILLGRMNLRSRFDRLIQLFKAQNRSDQAKVFNVVRQSLGNPIGTRNFVIHGVFFGCNFEVDEPRLYYGIEKAFLDDEENEMRTIMEVTPYLVQDAAKAFRQATETLSGLYPELHE